MSAEVAEPEQQTQETPPAEQQPSPHDSFLAKIRGESGSTDPQPEAKPEAEPEPKEETPADPIGDFLGNKKEEPPKEDDAGDKPKEEEEDDGIDPSTLKRSEDWTRAKETIREKVASEYENRLTSLEAKIAEREKEIEELSGTVSQYNIAKSPAYRKNYLEPKRQAIEAVERLGGDSEEVKALANKMRSNTLTISDVPNLDSLGEFQKRRIYDLADKWMQTHEQEQIALENHKETQKQLELEELEMEKAQSQKFTQHVGNQLHHATSKALTEASQRLPGFSQEHSETVINQLRSANPLDAISKSLAIAAWAPTQMAAITAARDEATGKLKEAQERIASLEKRLGGADDLNKLTSSGSTPGSGNESSGDVPHDAFMKRIHEAALKGM